MNSPEIPWDDIDAAIVDGRMVDAVRMYRLASGSAIGPTVLLLNERRTRLEQDAASSGRSIIAAPEPAVHEDAMAALIRLFEDSAFCPVGGRIAAWRNRRGEVCVLHRRDGRSVEVNVLPASGQFGHDLHGFSMSNESLVQRLESGGNLEPADFGDTESVSALILRQLAPKVEPATHPEWQPSRATILALDALRFEARYAFHAETWTPTEWHGVLDRAQRLSGFDELIVAAAAEPLQGEGFVPGPAQSRLLLNLCVAECAADQVCLDSEHFFADLAARRIDQVPFAHRDAWAALVGVADPTGLRRSTLPPWLERATRHNQLAGLSPPGLARFLVPRLEGCLPPGPDLDTLWTFLAGAAGRGNWLLGLAPSS